MPVSDEQLADLEVKFSDLRAAHKARVEALAAKGVADAAAAKALAEQQAAGSLEADEEAAEDDAEQAVENAFLALRNPPPVPIDGVPPGGTVPPDSTANGGDGGGPLAPAGDTGTTATPAAAG